MVTRLGSNTVNGRFVQSAGLRFETDPAVPPPPPGCTYLTVASAPTNHTSNDLFQNASRFICHNCGGPYGFFGTATLIQTQGGAGLGGRLVFTVSGIVINFFGELCGDPQTCNDAFTTTSGVLVDATHSFTAGGGTQTQPPINLGPSNAIYVTTGFGYLIPGDVGIEGEIVQVQRCIEDP